ncbi:sigma-70 family RNA polymerase sigma factor [Bacillus sp. 31A1R]|uniref:Sigma-70 family RNA polymerase sigma factor n=1 Tax=Robertmurraya mangrovi TaxID=3098077 RepID=A0ABU5IW85_9BACI|nr:sigma-70 family RNA polymerase sigma factor [Bacillus sp. 31A1R]MDZ5471423.1 sigma-70 family RNA polymerase sigma factor [Bacillus sp. 31A1R]
MKDELKWIQLIKKKGSQEAANQLVSSYYKEIYAYVYKQTLNKELSMDLTQEIFISMLHSIQHFDESKSSFKTWIYRIATNRVIDWYRSKNYKSDRLTESIEDYEVESEEDFTLSIERKEEVEKITEVVSKLDTFTQQIFRLKLFAEYTFNEISSILQLPEATIKTKYYSMLKRVKSTIEEDNHAKRKASN